MKIKSNLIVLIIGIFLLGLLAGKYFLKSEKSIPKQEIDTDFSHQNKSKASHNPITSIPLKAIDTWHYIRLHHEAPEGYIGGRKFQNRERNLPIKNEQGNRITYFEWDVNPKTRGQNRGSERIVSEEYEKAWYTNDHYQSFTEIKE